MTHHIYTLSNPFTKAIFYVGSTAFLKIRRKQHEKKFSPLFNGASPLFDLLDSIDGPGRHTSAGLERYWICQLRAWGFKLINKTIPRADIERKIVIDYLVQIGAIKGKGSIGRAGLKTDGEQT